MVCFDTYSYFCGGFGALRFYPSYCGWGLRSGYPCFPYSFAFPASVPLATLKAPEAKKEATPEKKE